MSVLKELQNAYANAMEILELRYGNIHEEIAKYEEEHKALTEDFNRYVDKLWVADTNEYTHCIVIGDAIYSTILN